MFPLLIKCAIRFLVTLRQTTPPDVTLVTDEAVNPISEKGILTFMLIYWCFPLLCPQYISGDSLNATPEERLPPPDWRMSNHVSFRKIYSLIMSWLM